MLYYCMTEINECKDWTKVEQDLQQKVHKLYKQNLNKEDFMKLMKMIDNISSMMSQLSIEEIECRRKQKQTKKHLVMITKINADIDAFEQLLMFGVLLKG